MQRESKARWDAEHITTVSFRCHNEKDKDILARLAAQPAETGGKQGYIKRLIREDIARSAPHHPPILPDLP